MYSRSFHRGGRRGQKWREDDHADPEGRVGPLNHHRQGRQHGWSGERRDAQDTGGNDQHESIDGGTARRGRGRGRPPGLKGKEIGLYYAKMGKERRQREDREQRPVVGMDSRREAQIRNLLHNINTTENIQPQPTTSYHDPSNMEAVTDDKDASPPSMSRYQPADLDHGKHDIDMKEHSHIQGQGLLESTRSHIQSRSIAGASYSAAALIDEEQFQDVETMEDKSEISSIADVLRFTTEEMDFPIENEQVSNMEGFQSISNNPALDASLQKEFESKTSTQQYKRMLEFRKKLPAFKMREELLEVINQNQVTVISGETGCGKTTQVPQFILDHFLSGGKGSSCRVVCTQPRRISAVSVAERVADERADGCRSGGSVGYQIRLESKIPRQHGSILYCTTGIVLKWLESDPLLMRASHIILDEIHERDLLSDFLIIILRDLLARRPDLKVLLMSATLNAEKFSNHFGGAPIVHIPGFTFPVEEYFLEDVIELLAYVPEVNQRRSKRRMYGRKWRDQKDVEQEERAQLHQWMNTLGGKYSPATLRCIENMDLEEINIDLMGALIEHIAMWEPIGAILVFVPGWSQINNLNKLLLQKRHFNSDRFLIIPLHSLMPTVNQRKVFERPPPGVRKIIIATNIAETSITIDDVVYVIDCGKIKVKNFEADKNLTTLEPQWVAHANAKQRRGRAGRVQPGRCYHLYTSLKQSQLVDYLPPEILRTRLEELCLHIKLLKLGNIKEFVAKALDKPPMEALDKAIYILQSLNALDSAEQLLPLGYHLAKMPLDPQVGKMVLFAAMFGCLDPVLTVAASLGFKDAFVIPLGKEKEADRVRKQLSQDSKSDHLMLIYAYQQWERLLSRGTDKHYCWENFLSSNTLHLLKNMKQQLATLLHHLGFLKNSNIKDVEANRHSKNDSLVKAVLCAGLYPNVAKITKVSRANARFKSVKLETKENRKVCLHPKSVNYQESTFESKWMIYHQMMKTNEINLFDCTMISPFPLLFFGGDIDIRVDGDQNCIVIDDWIVFQASPKIATLVKDLRRELDRLLEQKIKCPGPTNWNDREKEGAVMKEIIGLITMEDDNINSTSDQYYD